MFWIAITLVCSACLVNEGWSAQTEVMSEKPIIVDFHDGRLSVSAKNILLIELMRIVGTKAGFKVASYGNFSGQIGSWSFANLPLNEAIGKMLRGTSAIVSYGHAGDSSSELSVSTVYLVGSRPAGNNAVHINTIEPTLSNQLLMDQTQSDDIQNRVAAIDRLEGLTDELTMTSLVFSLQHDADPNVRSHAVTAIAQVGGSVAATALEKGLGDANASVRKKVVDALGNIQDERISLWLGQILMGDSSAAVRLQAVRAIARKSGNTARIFLEAAVGDSSKQVSDAAVRLLQ